MKTFTLVAFAVLGAQAATIKRQFVACSGLYGTAQCCATDVLGVADLDCANPPATPTDAANFTDICAAIGQTARCCVLPVLGQDVLCEDPTGTT